MDNKIILELVAKNLEEIKLLVEALRNGEKADPLLIEITSTKAKTLYHELMLLSPIKHDISEIEKIIACDELLADENDFETIPPKETVAENEVLSSPEIENSKIDIQETAIIEPETVITELLASSGEPEHEIAEEPELEVSEDTQIEADADSTVNQPTEETIVTDEMIVAVEVETETIYSQVTIDGNEIEKTITEIHDKKIIGEQFIKEPSVYEKLAASSIHESKVKGIPVTNIMNAIGINDRFLFTRELFGNDSKIFEDTVNQLDVLNNFLEAIDFLEANCKWTKNEASLKFMELLKRRFEN